MPVGEGLTKYEAKKHRKEQRIAESRAKAREHRTEKKKAQRHRRQEERQALLHSMEPEEREAFLAAERAESRSVQEKQHASLRQAYESGAPKVVINCSFGDSMSEMELSSLATQAQLCYTHVRQLQSEMQLHLTSLDSSNPSLPALEALGLKSWLVHVHEKPVWDLFDQELLVILSPDAEEDLEEVVPDHIYVIGGLVDRAVDKNRSFEQAKEGGNTCFRRLPLKRFGPAGAHPVLNIDVVVRILAEVLRRGKESWTDVFKACLPTRHTGQLSRRGKERLRKKEGQAGADDAESESAAEDFGWNDLAAGCPSFISDSTTFLEGFPVTGKDKYNGGVKGADGRIYAIPANAQKILAIDPKTASYEYLEGDPLPGTQKWLRGVFNPSDGCVYGLPCWSTAVLKIDTRPRAPQDAEDASIPAEAQGMGWTRECDQVVLEVVKQLGPEYTNKTKYWLKVARMVAQRTKLSVENAKLCENRWHEVKSKTIWTLLDSPPELKEAMSLRWKFHGGALGDDGDVYAVPCNAPGVLRVDTKRGQVSIIGNPALFREKQLWYGAVKAHTGAIYAFPQNAAGVLKVSPDNENTKVEVFGDLGAGEWKWHGGVFCTTDNCVYGIPNNNAQVLRVDPETDDIQLFGDASIIEGGRHRRDGKYKYEGAVVGTDGNIYCIPGDTEQVLKINVPRAKGQMPSVENMGPRLSGDDDTNPRSNKWQNGFCGPDNIIYCVPLTGNGVLRIDIEKQDVDQIFPESGPMYGLSKWQSGAMGDDGCYYATPFQHGRVLRISPKGFIFQPPAR